MRQPGLYALRYPLVPEEPRQKRLDQLLQFCDEAKIDEVIFFVLPEEYCCGQWDPKYYEPWLEFAVQAKEIVERKGLKVSLNPWHTLLHTDRGRKSEQLKFRRMILDTGHECLSVGCPLCEDWRNIFYGAFKRFAQAGFKRIWVEDDFRFHNHNSGNGWGGCFCPTHIQKLHELGAQATTREQLIANLTATGIVHPDRKIWMDLNAKTYIELAKKMRATMDSVDPSIELGLMTSYIPTHAIEGRDWTGLINALGGPEKTVVRPHAAGYSENCQAGFFWGFGNLSMTLGVLPKGTKTYFEVENAPMSAFSKSNYQTAMQMASVLEGGCDGLSLDILDFLGSGPSSEPGMAQTLAKSKEKYQAIQSAIAGTTPSGIQAIIPIATPARAPGKGGSVGNIPSSSYGWFAYLGGFGYPCQNKPVLEKVDPSAVYALLGDGVWGLTDDQLRQLLQSGTVLLEAEAVRLICERGMGELIGVKGFTRLKREESCYSYEELIGGDPNEIPERASINWPQDSAYAQIVQLLPFATQRTVIKDCFGKILGPGTITYKNSTGGKGLIYPFPVPECYELHTWARKAWLDNWLNEFTGGVKFPNLKNTAWVYLAARSGPNQKTIFLANQTFENYDHLDLQLPPDYAKLNWTVRTTSNDEPATITMKGNQLRIETKMRGNDWLMLVGK